MKSTSAADFFPMKEHQKCVQQILFSLQVISKLIQTRHINSHMIYNFNFCNIALCYGNSNAITNFASTSDLR